MNEIAFNEFSNDGQDPNLPAPTHGNGMQGRLPAGASMTSPRSLISPRETLDFQIKGNGKNKLLELAIPLLGLAVRIRNMGSFDDIDALHSRLTNEIANFQHEAAALGYDEATTLAARYCLCSMIDESVLSQPWGADSLWPERPMLSIFHNETWGGEKVFGILDRVMDECHRFLDLLEFLFFCLTLGFEGKYHVMHNGQAKLDALILAVYKILEKHSGEAPGKLLHPDVNIYDQKQSMSWRAPVWVVMLVGVVALVGIHIYFDQKLDSQIAKIQGEITQNLEGSN